VESTKSVPPALVAAFVGLLATLPAALLVSSSSPTRPAFVGAAPSILLAAIGVIAAASENRSVLVLVAAASWVLAVLTLPAVGPLFLVPAVALTMAARATMRGAPRQSRRRSGLTLAFWILLGVSVVPCLVVLSAWSASYRVVGPTGSRGEEVLVPDGIRWLAVLCPVLLGGRAALALVRYWSVDRRGA